MKPIMQLKSFRTCDTAVDVLRAMKKLFQDPKRHAKNKFFAGPQGGYAQCPQATVAVCAFGAVALFSGTPTWTARQHPAGIALNDAAQAIYPEAFVDYNDAAEVNNGPGGRVKILRVIDQALKDLGA
jgi:hypothetical protein